MTLENPKPKNPGTQNQAEVDPKNRPTTLRVLNVKTGKEEFIDLSVAKNRETVLASLQAQPAEWD